MITARSEAFNVGDFSLAADEDLSPIGPAIIDKWMGGDCYCPDAAEDDQAYLLDYFLKSMMCKPTVVNLHDAGRYAGTDVTWIPGHLVGDRS